VESLEKDATEEKKYTSEGRGAVRYHRHWKEGGCGGGDRTSGKLTKTKSLFEEGREEVAKEGKKRVTHHTVRSSWGEGSSRGREVSRKKKGKARPSSLRKKGVPSEKAAVFTSKD